jgi:serine/threonine protein kinase
MHGNIYPSPEKILFKNGYINEPDQFLSDLFSLGVTLLEMYLLEHMDIIYEKGCKRILETKLVEAINKVTSKELKKRLKIILSQEPVKRKLILKEYELTNSKAETFINLEKQSFKKEYIRNMLVTS